MSRPTVKVIALNELGRLMYRMPRRVRILYAGSLCVPRGARTESRAFEGRSSIGSTRRNRRAPKHLEK